jgi:cell division protein FtsB
MPFYKLNKNSFGFRFFLLSLSIVLLLMVVYLFWANWKLFNKVAESIKNREVAEASLNSLISRQADLEKKVEDLGTDSGIEKEIRERFPVAKQGEEVIMVVDKKSGISDLDSDNSRDSWWQKFLKWVKE